MSSVESLPSSQLAASNPSRNVVLSPFVNERFPAWEDLLSAHDVARLTRRPRWLLISLVLLGRFPRRRRYHGRSIGWSRADVARWLGSGEGDCLNDSPRCGRTLPGHKSPHPLEHTHTFGGRRQRDYCSLRRRANR